jgi:hypothetical protein
LRKVLSLKIRVLRYEKRKENMFIKYKKEKSVAHKKATLHYCKAALNVFTTE